MTSDARFELAPDAGERTTLVTFLAFQRAALERKCDELTDSQMRLRPITSSSLSLIGLVRHLAGVERWYFSIILGGADPTTGLFEIGEDFDDVDQATAAEAFGAWRREVQAAQDVMDGLDLDDTGAYPGDDGPQTGPELSLRWVITHMIDEYARHLGHADLLREAIDGRTGE